jgi:hypothetical protein
MTQKKINNSGLAKLVQEHVAAINRIDEMESQLERVDSLIERFESGEEISEEELNELMGGLGALGKWGAQKAKSALGSAGNAIGQAASSAGNAIGQAAGDAKQQYQKGQRASAINKQRKTVDKRQGVNNEKASGLAIKGRQINDAIKKYQAELTRIGAEYENLTGKKYVPGRAVANAQRYQTPSF